MRKTVDECKQKLQHRTDDARLKLIYGWVKEDEISFDTFTALIQYHQDLLKQDLVD